jgi:hypothetical protein
MFSDLQTEGALAQIKFNGVFLIHGTMRKYDNPGVLRKKPACFCHKLGWSSGMILA